MPSGSDLDIMTRWSDSGDLVSITSHKLIQKTREPSDHYLKHIFSNEKVWGFLRLNLASLLAVQTWQNNIKYPTMWDLLYYIFAILYFGGVGTERPMTECPMTECPMTECPKDWITTMTERPMDRMPNDRTANDWMPTRIECPILK